MKLEWLSDEWFAAVKKLVDDAGIPVPEQLEKLTLNITVQRDDAEDKEICIKAGLVEKELDPEPDNSVFIHWDLAKSLFMSQDIGVGMDAFLDGEFIVEGDFAKLLSMQSLAGDPEQEEIMKQVVDFTA